MTAYFAIAAGLAILALGFAFHRGWDRRWTDTDAKNDISVYFGQAQLGWLPLGGAALFVGLALAAIDAGQRLLGLALMIACIASGMAAFLVIAAPPAWAIPSWLREQGFVPARLSWFDRAVRFVVVALGAFLIVALVWLEAFGNTPARP